VSGEDRQGRDTVGAKRQGRPDDEGVGAFGAPGQQADASTDEGRDHRRDIGGTGQESPGASEHDQGGGHREPSWSGAGAKQ
jgi:hypothetical protein